VLLSKNIACQASRVYVHLFNWPVSPALGWADPVKITTSGKVLIFNSNQIKRSFVAYGLER
jgi:hypothetical protein